MLKSIWTGCCSLEKNYMGWWQHTDLIDTELGTVMWGGESPNRIDAELGNWGTVMWGGESPNRIDAELGNKYVGWWKSKSYRYWTGEQICGVVKVQIVSILYDYMLESSWAARASFSWDCAVTCGTSNFTSLSGSGQWKPTHSWYTRAPTRAPRCGPRIGTQNQLWSRKLKLWADWINRQMWARDCVYPMYVALTPDLKWPFV